jgi:MFS superfamily sulfate permease-like transporter
MEETKSEFTGNRYGRMEWAGAFGDLGTLVPFVIAYITLLDMDPLGILLGFSVSLIVCGLFYRTPFPVQPMKAIGAVATMQAAQTVTLTAGAVHAASLATGFIWLFLGLTGLSKRVSGLIGRPVAIGIVLGLGLGFMLEGMRMMSGGWVVSIVALFLTLILIENRFVPAMFMLLIGGAAVAFARDPDLIVALSVARIEPRLPEFSLSHITWSDIANGLVFLALPQVPLTLGNAIIAVTDENNRLFPDRPVTERSVSISTGIMNIFGGAIGGVPMCHGAGGMAGHVRFGARTGGSLVILGGFLAVLGILFSGSVGTIFSVIPREVLGVILFLTGAQLALGSCDFAEDKGMRFVTIVTAGMAMWNIGLAFVVGLSIHNLIKRGLIRL